MHTRCVTELIIKCHSWLLDNVRILLPSLSTLASLSLNLLLSGGLLVMLVLLLSLLLLLELMAVIMKEPIVINLIELDFRLVLIQ